jgi:predicted peptidase
MHTIKLSAIITIIFSFITISHCQAAGRKAPAWAAVYKPSTFKEMPYRLMDPLNFDSSKKYPLILSLHGAGGRGNDNKKQLKNWNQQLTETSIRKDFPAYVLTPQSTGLWNGDQLKTIQELIKTIPSVDMNRIYVLGHSMGGHGTFIYIQLAPDYFAAAAPSAGTGLKSTEGFIDAKVIKDIPIWTSHGDKDRTCPYDKVQKLFVEVKSLGGNMKLTSWHGGNHGVSDKFIPGDKNSSTEMSSDRCDPEPNFLKWLFKQKLKN